MEKRPIQLTEKEIIIISTVHKEMMESIGRNIHDCTKQKAFEMFAVSIGLTISNFMNTFGVDNINPFLDYLMDNIKRQHEIVRKFSGYMEYKKGMKVSEGQFN